METKPLLLYIGFIVLVSFLAFFIFGGFDINWENPVKESGTQNCNLTFKNNISVTEGENLSISVVLETPVTGEFKAELFREPPFMTVEKNITATSKKTIFELKITNASNERLRWESIKLELSGAAECDSDIFLRIVDNCPHIYNPDQADVDGDGIGDVCDEYSCGDGICNGEENQTACCEDCGCPAGQTCENNTCIGEAFACTRDNDCIDSVACTTDICFHKNTSYAFCGHLEIQDCKDDDGCCLEDFCNANNDNDCEPECGNGICETAGGESYQTCKRDCEED